jgi:hypothetical protein
VLKKIQGFLNIKSSAGRVTDIFGEAYCLRIQGSQRRIYTVMKMEATDFYEISESVTNLHGVIF